MTTIKLSEQITFLRKKHRLTQEELANALGVTNHAVSKWESGQCCPDIQLLPAISRLFGVSVDELLSCSTTETLGTLCSKIKNFFVDLPPKEALESAYHLAALLHEAAISDGYKTYIPWQEKDYSTDDISSWGLSLCSEPEGSTGRSGRSIFFSLGKGVPSPTPAQLHGLSLTLKRFSDLRILKVMYVLHSLSIKDSGFHLTAGETSSTAQLSPSLGADYSSADEIAALAQLSVEDTRIALEQLPLLIKEEHGRLLYRLDDSFCHVPLLLSFLFQFYSL